MAVSKVIYGGNTLIDLTGDTVTASTLIQGATAHNAAGQVITGTAPDFDALFPVGSFLSYPTNPSSIKGDWVKVATISLENQTLTETLYLWKRVSSLAAFSRSTFGFNGSSLQGFNHGTLSDTFIKDIQE